MTVRSGRFRRFAERYLFAAGATLYLFGVGWRHPRHRKLISTLCEHFGYPERRNETIPFVELEELVDDSVPVQVREAQAVDGNVSLYELLAICKLVHRFQPQNLFEFGTFDGRTTLNLAANAPPGARVYTLDLPPSQVETTSFAVETSERTFIEKERSGSRFHDTEYSGVITQLHGDSASVDLAPYEGRMGFVFVDASHAYEYVINDSGRALRLLGPEGGIVLWHDYGVWEGVTVGLNELHAKRGVFEGMRRVAGTSLVLLSVPSRSVEGRDDG